MSAEAITAITMPKWGMAMEEGTVVGWHVAAGAPVRAGDELLDIESTKATGAIEARQSGILRRQVATVGEIVPVGGVLGVIAAPEVSDAAIDEFLGGLPIATRTAEESASRLRKVTVGGYELQYADEGSDGPPILLLHGFGGNHDSWTYSRAALAPRFRVISPDLPGHGESEDSGARTPEDLGAAILGLMDVLAIEPAHVVAHSMGGAVAMALAASQPRRLRSLTLIASTGLGPDIDGAYIAGFLAAKRRRDLRPVIERLFADKALVSDRMLEEIIRMKRIDGVEAALARLAEAQFPGGCQAPSELRQRLVGSGIACQGIWGSEDAIVPVAHAEGLGVVHVLTGAGHMVHMERPAEVNTVIEQFVGSL